VRRSGRAPARRSVQSIEYAAANTRRGRIPEDEPGRDRQGDLGEEARAQQSGRRPVRPSPAATPPARTRDDRRRRDECHRPTRTSRIGSVSESPFRQPSGTPDRASLGSALVSSRRMPRQQSSRCTTRTFRSRAPEALWICMRQPGVRRQNRIPRGGTMFATFRSRIDRARVRLRDVVRARAAAAQSASSSGTMVRPGIAARRARGANGSSVRAAGAGVVHGHLPPNVPRLSVITRSPRNSVRVPDLGGENRARRTISGLLQEPARSSFIAAAAPGGVRPTRRRRPARTRRCLRRARSRASSRSPACCGKRAAAGLVDRWRRPRRRAPKNRAVAAFVSPKTLPITQPWSIATRPRCSPRAGNRGWRASLRPIGYEMGRSRHAARHTDPRRGGGAHHPESLRRDGELRERTEHATMGKEPLERGPA